jgi:AMP phosphorylase
MYMTEAFEVRKVNVRQGAFEILLHQEDAAEHGLRPLDRVKLFVEGRRPLTVIVDTTDTVLGRGEVGVYLDVWEKLRLEEGLTAKIAPVPRPPSVDTIRKKINGQQLTRDEIYRLVRDMVEGNLTPVEVMAYAVAVQINDMTMDEVVHLTQAMVESGDTIEFSTHPVMDIHSIGGVPGNKYAAITVPIAAANGLLIPKTSSRAISSACGTADYMEVVTEVVHPAEEIRRIAEEVGATLVWGGGVNLAPADDIIIRVEHALSLDPHAQVLASVLAKKIAAGVDRLVIDIPMGRETKVETSERAKRLARDFIELGRRLGIEVICAITYGGQPIGRSIGPALEVREALSVLEGAQRPRSIIEKSLELAGLLLELGGAARPGAGKKMAEETLRSGRALEKFREIVAAQGGDPDITSSDIRLGRHSRDILSPRDGYVEEVHNRALTRIARAAGAPKDRAAGVLIHKKEGQTVEEGEPLLTIFSDVEWKLETAVKLAEELKPMRIEGMILEEIVE